jgi:predicted Zn-dependent protease
MMFGHEQFEGLLKRALGASEAPETEVVILAMDEYLTRFANNGIHQNVAETNVSVYFRAIDGKRAGQAVTGNLSDEGLKEAAERALLHARQQREDPDFPGLPDPEPIPAVQAIDEETIEFSPVERAEAVGVICRLAADRDLQAFGAFTTGLYEVGMASSRGVMAYHPVTRADLQTVVMGDNGSGRAQESTWEVAKINAERVGLEAVEKATRVQNPQTIKPGKYTVVLDPYATDDILSWLDFAGMSALTVQEGRSWMNDRIGQQVMSPLVSIWDDGHDPSGIPMPLGFDGLPRQRVVIVDKGVIGYPVYDYATAKKEGIRSTGHALPPFIPPWFRGPHPLNLFMAEGDATVEEMITSTQRGLYITRFWYTRLVHPRDCVLTGMTRDGVMMIENGELTFPVKNLRFTQSYVEAMANVEAVGSEAKLLAEDYGFAQRVPGLKIRDFMFTGITV